MNWRKLLGSLGKVLVQKYGEQVTGAADTAIDKAADKAKQGVRKGLTKIK